jgi:hypothetical protein
MRHGPLAVGVDAASDDFLMYRCGALHGAQ